MDVLIHLVALLARNRILLIPAFLLAAIPGWRASDRYKWLLRLTIVACALASFLGAPILADWLLHRFGVAATAQVVGTYATWIEINDREAIGYKVLIRTAADVLIESRFEDDEVNVFPPANISYPQPNETFGVRYLPRFPRDFIILTDDDSPWMQRQRCDVLSLRLTTAQQRFTFARGALPYRSPYVAAIDAYLRQGCAEGAETSFREERTRAQTGLVDPGQ